MAVNMLVLINGRSPFFRYWHQYANWEELDIHPIFCSIYDFPTDIIKQHPEHEFITITGQMKLVRYLKLLWKIKGIIDKYHIDIVHTHYLSHHGLISLLRSQVPTAITLYGTDINSRSKLDGMVLGWLVRRGSLFHAQSSSSLNIMKSIFRIPESKLYLKHLGIDPLFLNNAFTTKEPIILSARSIGSRYNTLAILQAFKQLHDKVPDLQLILLKGFSDPSDPFETYYQKCLDFINDQQLDSRVTVIDRILNKSELLELYHKSMILVSVPPRDQFALTIIEGMAMDCVPILSDVPAYHEYLDDHNNALFWQNTDITQLAGLMQKAVQDHDLRRRILGNNHEIVQSIGTLDVNLNQILRRIKSIADEK